MIEVGEYVRTENGYIRKIVTERLDGCLVDKSYYNEIIQDNTLGIIENEDIVKHSKNIIDLIEVGDYVNGEKVYSRCNSKLWLDGDEGEILIVDGKPDEPIISIVTKEQFANIEYRLED